MKSQSKLIAVKFLLLLVCGTMFSFSPKAGGDSFEIILNGKRVLQQSEIITLLWYGPRQFYKKM